MDYELTYADNIQEGAALVERIRRETDWCASPRLGFDTEFYDVELGKHSVLGRAKVHFASLAWDYRGSKLHPRGFSIPRAAVVSREVVTKCPEFRAWFEEPRFTFLAHNAPVDAHTFWNEGIKIRNVVNTLTLARWTWPHRAARWAMGAGFGLDALGKDYLGEGKLAEFDEIFSEVQHVRTPVPTTVCTCGTPKCRKRSGPHVKLQATTYREEDVVTPIPLQSVVPGQRIFETALRYAAQDAVLAFALDQVICRTLQSQIRNVPWLPRLPSLEG